MKTFLLTITQKLLMVGLLLVLPVSASLVVFAQPEDRVVALVNGREIRQREVDQLLIAQVMPLEEQLYAIRKAALENLILTALLEQAAEHRGVSLQELRKMLTAGNVEVRLAEVENEYAENFSAFGAMSPDEARERLRLDLETRARLAKYKQAVTELRRSAAVEIYLDEPRWPWFVTADNSPVLGPEGGPVTIIEFADFQCPYCRESQRVVQQVLKAYGNEVRLIFKHLPLDVHSAAFNASRAAFCAGEQDRFWEYHDALFGLEILDADNLRRAAGELGLSLKAFDACVDSEVSREAVARDKREAARWGISGTPTFIVNGKMIRGATDFETFKHLIEQERTSARARSQLTGSGPPDVRRKK